MPTVGLATSTAGGGEGWERGWDKDIEFRIKMKKNKGLSEGC